jgi:hypothetical protein
LVVETITIPLVVEFFEIELRNRGTWGRGDLYLRAVILGQY